MTLAIDEATPLGALYGAAKRYPGGIDQLAKDMDVKRPTLYAKLRGEKGYPLSPSEVDEILNFLRSRDVPDWAQFILVFCHNHDHLAIPIPRAMRLGDAAGLQQVSEMMQEVADIARVLSDGIDSTGAGGQQITTSEWKKIDKECAEAMEKIAETREIYKARHLAAKKKGLVK